jgi:hypothetical protein
MPTAGDCVAGDGVAASGAAASSVVTADAVRPGEAAAAAGAIQAGVDKAWVVRVAAWALCLARAACFFRDLAARLRLSWAVLIERCFPNISKIGPR